MAKKKQTQQLQNQENEPTNAPNNTNNASSDKLDSLKSLNSMLLKETVERRQQMETLEQERLVLATELKNHALDKNELRVKCESLEVENGVLGEFVRTQMKELAEKEVFVAENEAKMVRISELEEEVWRLSEKVGAFEGVLKEKDVFEVENEDKRVRICELEEEVGRLSERVKEKELVDRKLEAARKVIEGLRERVEGVLREKEVVEVNCKGKKVRICELEEEVGRLNEKVKEKEFVDRKLEEAVRDIEGVLTEKKVIEVENEGKRVRIGELEEEVGRLSEKVREKELVDRKLEEAVRDVETLRKRVEGVLKEKEVFEMESKGKGVRIGELKDEVGRLSGFVEGLRKEETVLRGAISELERRCEESVEREKRMAKEIGFLSEEKNEKERDVQVLNEERVSIWSALDRAKEELHETVRKVSELVDEKNEIEKLKGVKEGEIFELQTEVDSLRDVISKLQVSCRSQMDKNDQLAEEVCQFKDIIGKITVERDDARKGYNEEKKNGTELRARVVEMEKKISDNLKELEKVKAEHEKLVKINTNNDVRVEKLVREKDMLTKKLKETESKNVELGCQIESVSLNSERTLTLLKKAAEFFSQSAGNRNENGGGVLSKGKLPRDLQPYEKEVEAIKKAFSEKETKIEDMKQQVESLQDSVVDAEKKKSFWTIVSSVTTLFAAISVAFAATGHGVTR